jgi:hypothetical protein
MNDQDWWEKHRLNDDDWYDRDGYDRYGYNAEEVDRAGYTEWDYLGSGERIEDEYCYPLYEDVAREWGNKIIGQQQ